MGIQPKKEGPMRRFTRGLARRVNQFVRSKFYTEALVTTSIWGLSILLTAPGLTGLATKFFPGLGANAVRLAKFFGYNDFALSNWRIWYTLLLAFPTGYNEARIGALRRCC